MLSRSDDNQSEVIEAFNSTSRYLDDLLNFISFINSSAYIFFRKYAAVALKCSRTFKNVL